MAINTNCNSEPGHQSTILIILYSNWITTEVLNFDIDTFGELLSVGKCVELCMNINGYF